ncbi:MAG: hypothetical protein HY695_33340 [Deltaproteobacteria bacterium]|nr:hypothetical protein [Deltaproteobacteria bacterium]
MDTAKRTVRGLVVAAHFVLVLAVFAVNGRVALAVDYEFTSIDFPGALSTAAFGINNLGDIVGGRDTTPSGGGSGFLLSGGTFTSIDFPPGSFSGGAHDINDAGEIVGEYRACCGADGRGFLVSEGSFSTFDVPGAVGTMPWGINNAGQIAGAYNTDHFSCCYAFILDGDNVQTFEFPGASGTEAHGINDLGQIVGYYAAGGPTRGYLLSNGIFTTIDFPGAVITLPQQINDAGEIVGWYIGSDGIEHGFLLSGGVYRTIDFPGASRTFAQGINNAGHIVGYYNKDGRTHGFLAIPSVTYVGIDIKPGSFPNSINLGSGGNVPVAILSTSTFNAATVDPSSVTLASAPVQLKGKGSPMASLEDVNDDGLLDLVVHVSTSALQLTETDTEAVLEGMTFSGRAIWGSDMVRVVP